MIAEADHHAVVIILVAIATSCRMSAGRPVGSFTARRNLTATLGPLKPLRPCFVATLDAGFPASSTIASRANPLRRTQILFDRLDLFALAVASIGALAIARPLLPTAPGTAIAPATFHVEVDGLDAFEFEHGDSKTDQLVDRFDLLAFFGDGNGKGPTLAPCAASAADPVHIVVSVQGNVEIKHVAKPRHVQTTRCDIARDQQTDLASLETFQRFRALCLWQVAMQRHGIVAVLLERGPRGCRRPSCDCRR